MNIGPERVEFRNFHCLLAGQVLILGSLYSFLEQSSRHFFISYTVCRFLFFSLRRQSA